MSRSRPTYTFEQLMTWKAQSKDPAEQKRIRRYLRELRATPEGATLPPKPTRSVDVDGQVRTVQDYEGPPRSRAPFTGGSKHPVTIGEMDAFWASLKPLHRPPAFNSQFVLLDPGCLCSHCSVKNCNLVDAIQAGQVTDAELVKLIEEGKLDIAVQQKAKKDKSKKIKSKKVKS